MYFGLLNYWLWSHTGLLLYKNKIYITFTYLLIISFTHILWFNSFSESKKPVWERKLPSLLPVSGVWSAKVGSLGGGPGCADMIIIGLDYNHAWRTPKEAQSWLDHTHPSWLNHITDTCNKDAASDLFLVSVSDWLSTSTAIAIAHYSFQLKNVVHYSSQLSSSSNSPTM